LERKKCRGHPARGSRAGRPRHESVLLIFFFLKKMRNFLLDNMLSYDTQLFLENPERRFSKIIYA
jgi:hypothetical protein